MQCECQYLKCFVLDKFWNYLFCKQYIYIYIYIRVRVHYVRFYIKVNIFTVKSWWTYQMLVRFLGYIYLRNKLSEFDWSTTERREIRNFPYPSMFELTGCRRLTVKRGIRNVGQFLAAEVSNPGQNESQ